MRHFIIPSLIFVAFSMSAPSAHAAEVLINGIKYSDPGAALSDFRRIIDNRLSQIPPNYLEAVKVSPIGGHVLVVTPSVESATQNYVWVKGLIKPTRETQETIAGTEIIRLETLYRIMERTHFIDGVKFVDEQAYREAMSRGVDYVVTFRPYFDGERTARSVQFRKTDFIVTSTRTGRQTVMLTTQGSPGSINDLYLFSQFRAAKERID